MDEEGGGGGGGFVLEMTGIVEENLDSRFFSSRVDRECGVGEVIENVWAAGGGGGGEVVRRRRWVHRAEGEAGVHSIQLYINRWRHHLHPSNLGPPSSEQTTPSPPTHLPSTTPKLTILEDSNV